MLWECEAGGRCLYASAYAETLLGLPRAAWLAEGFWRDRIHPADVEWVFRLREEALARGEPYTCDFRMQHANGSIVWVRERGRAVEHDRTPHLRGFATEIADFKRMEAELLHSRKLETLGRLVGGVAHDFTNLAMALTGYADVLLMQIEKTHPARPFAEQLKTSSGKAVSLVRQLLFFSRKREIEPTLVNLNDCVSAIVKLLGKVLGDGINVEADLDPDLGLVRVDPGQADQVLMNLAVNARDAMPQGGRLLIETRNVEGASTGRPGRWIALRAHDSGMGIPEDVKARVFEPFFTTKGAEGTGLGLALVREIVERSGGTIRVESAPGRGAHFEILLPRLSGEAAIIDTAAGSHVPGGTETILFVHDDETVRRLLCHGLERLGYRVLQAASGSAGLLAAEQHSGRVDLVVTDLVMADMSGLDLVRLARMTHPNLRSLLITGYGDNGSELPPEAARLLKPFRLEQLAQGAREILDAVAKRIQ